MARTPNPINFIQVLTANPITDPTTFITVITATYVVGHKDVSGNVTLYNHPSFLGAANGNTVQVTAQPTDTHQTTYLALQSALAAQEGLTLTGSTPDTIVLP